MIEVKENFETSNSDILIVKLGNGETLQLEYEKLNGRVELSVEPASDGSE